jgi:hypothetical protein
MPIMPGTTVLAVTGDSATVDRYAPRRDSRSIAARVDSKGVLGPGGVRYSWLYCAAVALAFALLIVDIFDDSAIWNYGVVVCIVIAIAARPGGLRGRRAAADAADPADAADDPEPHAT